jgi:hypothetical protein
VVIKNIIFWDITPCSSKTTDVSEEHIASIFSPKIGQQETSVKAECLFFDPEDGGGMFLRNVGWLSADYTALYLRR